MSEFMFGVTTARLTKAEIKRRDDACIAEGGTGFTYAKLPDGWRGWYTGPNLGHPFDAALRDRVLARVAADS